MRELAVLAVAIWLVFATGCGGDDRYAGLYAAEAKIYVRGWAESKPPAKTFHFVEASRSKTPRGTDAWLVRVVYEGGSLDVCAYIWRSDSSAAEVRPDEGCRHWKYD